MLNSRRFFPFLLALTSLVVLNSCKGKGLFAKKSPKSSVTGWNYNEKGGFQVAQAKDQATGPGLVFVEGGTFTMGQTEEDVMADWNNIPRRVSVPSFYMDRTEVANVHYREYPLTGAQSTMPSKVAMWWGRILERAFELGFAFSS